MRRALSSRVAVMRKKRSVGGAAGAEWEELDVVLDVLLSDLAGVDTSIYTAVASGRCYYLRACIAMWCRERAKVC